MCTHDKENHKWCDKGTAQKQYVTQEGVTREGVISAFHFSETRVFNLISPKIKKPNKYFLGNQTKFLIFLRNNSDCMVVDPYKARKSWSSHT